MIRNLCGVRALSLSFGALFLTSAAQEQAIAQVNAQPPLAAHRAVYDLKLVETRGKAAVQSVRGRILYDFSGDECQGYSLQFRQVTELDSGEGKVVTSDLRQTYWEEGAGKSFRFSSNNRLNGEEPEVVEGKAERANARLVIDLTKPEKKRLDVADAVFPADHMRRVIAAAREGKTLLEIGAYDGSDDGKKLFNTLTIIGQPIAAAQGALDGASSNKALSDQTRWPVTISYFEKTGKNESEQTPAYSLAFEVFENGVSRALKLDYGDFVLAGELTGLEVKEASACRVPNGSKP